MPSRPRLPMVSAFTLIELLVVVAIVGVLASLGFAGVQGAMAGGRKVREIGAARSLITAYASASADRDGRCLPGYDRTVAEFTQPNGLVLSGPPAWRYPYRLAPYYNYQVKGTILVNKNAQQIAESNTYSISCFPALGMNYIFIGGDLQANGNSTYPDECISNIARASSASLLVFSSAAGDSDGQRLEGYCILTPPRLTSQIWPTAAWKKGAPAGNYGNVDPRYGGKAVCAFLDGSVRMLSVEELRDMRLWNRNAAAQNKPDYQVPYVGGGGPGM